MVMKILISIGTLGLGGAEKQAVWLANRLSNQHEVTLLTYHGGVREKDLNPNVNWETIFENEISDGDLSTVTADLTDEGQSTSPQNDTSCFSDLSEGINSEPVLSRVMTWKKQIKYFLRKSPLVLKIVIQIYSSSALTIRMAKKTVLSLYKMLRAVRNYSVKIARYSFNLTRSIKNKFAKYVRLLVYSLTFPMLRLNIKNQTFVFRRARKAIKKAKPDIIVTFLFHDTLNVGLAGLLQFNRPKIIVGRRSPIGYGDKSRVLIHRLILRIIYMFSSAAVSNSAGNNESAIRDGIKSSKIRIISNYISKHRASETEPHSDEPLKIVCIANFHWYKNHEGLLRAISLIPDHEKYFHFTFIGDGPLRVEIQRLASDLNIAADFKGFVENPSSEIHLFDAMTLISHVEGSSNALLEGLASGIPALVSLVGAAEDLNAQGAPLVLCNPSDFNSIANGLTQLRSNYESLRCQARDYSEIISRTMNEESILKQWDEVIQSVISS